MCTTLHLLTMNSIVTYYHAFMGYNQVCMQVLGMRNTCVGMGYTMLNIPYSLIDLEWEYLMEWGSKVSAYKNLVNSECNSLTVKAGLDHSAKLTTSTQAYIQTAMAQDQDR